MTGADSVGSITESQIRACVSEKALYRAAAKELDHLDLIVADMRMDTSLAEGKDRVWNTYKEYKTAFRSAGVADLVRRKPHICIRHLVKRDVPPDLKNIMKIYSRGRSTKTSTRKMSLRLFGG